MTPQVKKTSKCEKIKIKEGYFPDLKRSVERLEIAQTFQPI